MSTVVLIIPPYSIIFLFGVLVGHGLHTRAIDQRSCRQAVVQRDLNLQFRLLREREEAAAEELAWQTKQQASLVIDYTPEEVPNPRPESLPSPWS